MKRFSWLIVVALLLGYFTTPELFAQPGGGRPQDRLQEVDPEEGARMLEALRNARYDGDFIFEFELRHFPRRGSTILYRGTLLGTWNESGPLTRVEIENVPTGSNDESDSPAGLRLLIQNGPERWIARYHQGQESPEILSGENLFKPLIPGFTYSPFDLQMPFLYWDDYEYEGAQRIKGRPAHLFLMKPPAAIREAAPGLEAVRIAVDEDYRALLRVEWLGSNGAVDKSYRILNFKRIEDQWLVKSLDLVDESAREKTRLRILSAAMRQDLAGENFHVDFLTEPLQYPSSVSFQTL